MGGGGAGYGVSIQGSNGVDNYNQPNDSQYNVVEECRFYGPYVRHGVLLQYWSHNNLVINNILTGTGYGSIDLHGEDEYLNEICYNTVIDCRWGGAIELGNSGAGHDKAGPMNYVHNNYLLDNYRGIDVVFVTDDTVIENNTIKNTTESAIWVDSGSRTSIRNNVIDTAKIGLLMDGNDSYTYNGVDYGGGDPEYSDYFGNTMTNATTAFSITAGQANTIEGATTSKYVSATSSNAHLAAIDLQGELNFLTLFIPEVFNYKTFTTTEEFSMELVPSAHQTTIIDVKVTDKDGKETTYTGKPSVHGSTTAGLNSKAPTAELTTVKLPLGENKVEITVTAEDGKTTETYTLTVTRLGQDEEIPNLVTSVTVNGGNLTVPMGWPEAMEISVTIAPVDASDKTITWDVADEEIVEIYSANGKYYINAKKAGTTEVTVISNSDVEVTDTVSVTVIDSLPYQPSSSDLDSNASSLNEKITSMAASTSDGTKLPPNLLDGDSSTSWAGQSQLSGSVVDEAGAAKFVVTLDEVYQLDSLQLSWDNAAIRKGYFEIYVSEDGEDYSLAFHGNSSGLTTLPETYLLGDVLDYKDSTESVYNVDMESSDYDNDGGVQGKYLKFVGYGNISNSGTTVAAWNSLNELVISGSGIEDNTDGENNSTPENNDDFIPESNDDSSTG